MIDHQIATLPNGIRLLYKPALNTVITHCCLIINTGSRDEDINAPGLAHFIEHVLFKGTGKRKSYQVLNRLELIGGDLNAYTTKEQTCIHASVLNEYTARAIELLADITFNASFPEQELEKEKNVIIDEIESYKDLPEELIQDEFDELLFAGHTLGNSILGTEQSVKTFQKKDVQHFIAANYLPEQIVVGVHSSLPFAKVQRIIEDHFGGISSSNKSTQRTPASGYTPQARTVTKNSHQAHALIGNRSYDLHHKLKLPMLLLNNILGGGMSAKLNLNIREKYGIAYSIESNYSPMSDCGFFSIYMGTDSEKIERCLRLVKKELRLLRETPQSAVALKQAKKRFIGQIGLSEESRLGVLIALCKNLLDHQRVDTLPEIYAKIEAITSAEMLQAANDVFDESQQSLLIYLPE